MTFTLPYPPALNNLHAVVRGRKVLSAKGRTYKAVAATEAMRQGVRPLAGRLRVDMTLYRPRKAGDLDGFFKSAFDSLKGIAWADDAQVEEIHAYRREDKANPRVTLTVSILPPGGAEDGGAR